MENRDKQQAASGKAARERVARQIWLHYFNQYLCSKGLITQEEKNRMRRKIG